MSDITKQPYAEWLEATLKDMVQLPKHINSLCIIGILEGGDVFKSYGNCNMMDKIIMSGVIQQDAMLDTLAANSEED